MRGNRRNVRNMGRFSGSNIRQNSRLATGNRPQATGHGMSRRRFLGTAAAGLGAAAVGLGGVAHAAGGGVDVYPTGDTTVYPEGDGNPPVPPEHVPGDPNNQYRYNALISNGISCTYTVDQLEMQAALSGKTFGDAWDVVLEWYNPATEEWEYVEDVPCPAELAANRNPNNLTNVYTGGGIINLKSTYTPGGNDYTRFIISPANNDNQTTLWGFSPVEVYGDVDAQGNPLTEIEGGYAAIRFDYASDPIVVKGLHCLNQVHCSLVTLFCSGGGLMEGNAFTNYHTGMVGLNSVYLIFSSNFTVRGNTFGGTPSTGITFLYYCNNNCADGNDFSGLEARYDHITIYYSHNNLIQNNTFGTVDLDRTDGIVWLYGANNNQIIGNDYTNCNTKGWIVSADHIVRMGCVFLGENTSGNLVEESQFPHPSDVCSQVADLTITNADLDGANNPNSWHIVNCQSADQQHLMNMIKMYWDHTAKMASLKDEKNPGWGPPPEGWPQEY